MSRFLALCLTACAAVACSSAARPPPYGDGVSPPAPGDTGIIGSDASTGPQACEIGPDGGVCGCLDLPLLTDVPNLYFVLDRSGSMNDADKWTTVRIVVAKTVVKLGPRINVGAAVFPHPQSGECVAGKEVMATRAGDSPAGTFGPTARLLTGSLDMQAIGGTPTSATVNAIRSQLVALPGRTFVILATDGGPNCNAEASCSYTECIPNIENASAECRPNTAPNCCDASMYGPASCLDGDATRSAVAALRSAGIATFVVGVPGSAPYASLLDELATAGGTARTGAPRYYRVDSTDANALSTALSEVAAKVTATCTLPLGAGDFDPNQVNVYLDDKVVPKDPVDGWSLDGTTVTLLGATCKKVMDGLVLGVRVVAGCPTVIR